MTEKKMIQSKKKLYTRIILKKGRPSQNGTVLLYVMCVFLCLDVIKVCVEVNCSFVNHERKGGKKLIVTMVCVMTRTRANIMLQF